MKNEFQCFDSLMTEGIFWMTSKEEEDKIMVIGHQNFPSLKSSD